MQIFVVGGSGRVATELIKDLVEMGHTVVAGARHSRSRPSPRQCIPTDKRRSASEVHLRTSWAFQHQDYRRYLCSRL